MSRPSSIVMDHFNSPRGAGLMDSPDASGQASRRGPLPAMRIYLRIADGRVQRAMFEAAGCGFTIACGSVMTELAAGRTIDECRAIRTSDVSQALGALPEQKTFCAELAVQALQCALDQYENK